MLQWMQNLRTFTANKLDLPTDVAMDLPRITIIGKLHIYIENHKGLLTFSDNEFRILLKHGQLIVKGQSFIIKTILADVILLEGSIEHVYFIQE